MRAPFNWLTGLAALALGLGIPAGLADGAGPAARTAQLFFSPG